jgi:uncharacterized protein (TIGR00297 family)
MNTPAAPIEHSADYRNVVHLTAFLLFAPLLGIIAAPRNAVPHGRWIVVGFMLCITVWNLLILPHQESGKVIRRADEGWVSGTWMYPLALAVAFAVLPVFAAMAGWAVMAGGDASASFFGRRVPRPKLPWNAKKSWVGLCGFIFGATPFALVSLFFLPSLLFLKEDGSTELPFAWTLAVLAAIAGAILESLDGPFDDNLRVPLGVGVILTGAAQGLSLATRSLPATTYVQPEFLIPALAVNAVLGAAILIARAADLPATVLGITLGVIVFFFTHWPGYALFLMFVAMGSGLSKVAVQRKRELGTDEPRGGKRGVANVMANLSVAAACCLAYPLSGGQAALLIAYAGALAAAFCDTASSEIGPLAKARPRLITSRKEVPHGTNGAVNLLGFFAGAAAAGLIAATAVLTGFLSQIGVSADRQPVVAGLVVLAGIAGSAMDSLLGATVEDRWPGVGKGAVNFACTLSGAAVAGGLSLLLL